MRWLPPIVCGSLVAALVCQVEAYWYPPWEGLGSCCGPISREDSLDDMRPLPITAVPWYAEWCAVDLYGEYELGDECVFRADSIEAEVIPATVTTVGRDACIDESKSSFEGTIYFIRSFAPAEPLTPGRRYQIDCGDHDKPGWVLARSNAARAAPPDKLEVTGRRIRQGDPECNSPGDYLDIRIEGIGGPSVDEGGYVELIGPLGEAFAITGWRSSWVSLPLVDGSFRFTPVAADGTRGETVEVDSQGADKEAVYLDCTVAPRRGSLALWVLAPLVWAGMQTRRRRRQ